MVRARPIAGAATHSTRGAACPRLAAALALVVVATLLNPVPAAAQTDARGVPETRIETVRLPDAGVRAAGRLRTRVAPDRPFAMLAFRAPAQASVRFRASEDGRSWEAWQPAHPLGVEEGPDPSSPERATPRDSHPVWVGPARWLEVDVTGAPASEVVVTAIDPLGLSDSLAERALSALRAAFGAPAAAWGANGAISRAQWGADESWRRSAPAYAPVRTAFVHHTAGSNDYTAEEAPAVVRGIYAYHARTLGWNDIGYNALVDRFGRIYEGRYGGLNRGVVGAHASGFNTGSFGVALMGNFEASRPPEAMLRKAAKILAWKLEWHGLTPYAGARTKLNGVALKMVNGHRDVGATACPGAVTYDLLPRLRSEVERRVLRGVTRLSGDWDGDGIDTPAYVRNGRWRLTDHLRSGRADRIVTFGRAGDVFVAGDWDGDGTDTPGIRRGRRWLLTNDPRAGSVQLDYPFGEAGDAAVTGDWDGDGVDTVGVRRDRRWFLRDTHEPGAGARQVRFGDPADTPVTGDWDGDGTDTVGVRRGRRWYLRQHNRAGRGLGHDAVFRLGMARDVPLSGDWSGGGTDTPGVARGSRWLLRLSPGGGPIERGLVYRG